MRRRRHYAIARGDERCPGTGEEHKRRRAVTTGARESGGSAWATRKAAARKAHGDVPALRLSLHVDAAGAGTRLNKEEAPGKPATPTLACRFWGFAEERITSAEKLPLC